MPHPWNEQCCVSGIRPARPGFAAFIMAREQCVIAVEGNEAFDVVAVHLVLSQGLMGGLHTVPIAE